MHRSIACSAIGGSLQEKLYAIAAAGFDAVELSDAELTYSELSPPQIRRLLDELGLSIAAFHGLYDVEGVPATVFAGTLRRAGHKLELMNELGATLLALPANTGAAALGDTGRAVEQLVALADRAASHGIRIGYESAANARFVRHYLDAWQIVDAASHPQLGVIVDSFDVLAARDDAADLARIPGDRILLVQLADAPAMPLDLDTLGRHFRCFPGQGALNVAGFAGYALDSGYDGGFSLDVRSDIIRAAPNRAAALDGYRSLSYVDEQLFRAGHAVRAPAFPASGPPAAPVAAVPGFVEFAVDSRSQADLENWLEGLGFRRVGAHRSKHATLYRQGDVLIVLNAGTDTFAHYYHHLHGTAVCAIGLRLDDPAALLARADLYRYKRYDERVGPQEYVMPAVRAPDGSLIHLLDRHYDPFVDFVAEDDDAASPGIVDRIDHLARAVPADQFDAWVLFSRTLLGLEADDSLELPDLHGIVRSRAFHDAGGELRLPLTYSEDSKTVVSRSLSSFGGAGINQIALATDDIFAAVAEMRERGVRLLNVPASYYRELAEDRDVPAQLVDELQAASILYDADSGGGRFFHVYTEFFNNRFFFEVVQREGGYAGYGERNAPVRMAAHAKHHPRRLAS